jgi:drug/metabolite transporter (DMT)-like permease
VLNTVLWTAVALVSFAANSLIARAALGPGADGAEAAIHPFAFTALRLAAGALALLPFGGRMTLRPSPGALALVAYALPFSLAYVALGAATGALLLFGTVQATLIASGVLAGERLRGRAAVGSLIAAGGLVWLLAPLLRTPQPWAALLMIVAGVAWGAYTLIGRRAGEPLRANAAHFVGALPAAALLAALPGAWEGVSAIGVMWGIVSGAVTSGLGYAAWYLALPGLERAAAATVQLAVPALAAAAAVALLGEPFDFRLALSGAAILGGIALVTLRSPARAPSGGS